MYVCVYIYICVCVYIYICVCIVWERTIDTFRLPIEYMSITHTLKLLLASLPMARLDCLNRTGPCPIQNTQHGGFWHLPPMAGPMASHRQWLVSRNPSNSYSQAPLLFSAGMQLSHTYILTYIYTHIHMYMYIHTTHPHTQKHNYTKKKENTKQHNTKHASSICMCVRMYVCVYTYIHTYIHVYICKGVCIYIYIYIHTHICICACVGMYTLAIVSIEYAHLFRFKVSFDSSFAYKTASRIEW